MNDIEKAARLMGLHELEYRRGSDAWYYTNPDSGREEFNPRTNKADLSDVIDELDISVNLHGTTVVAFKSKDLIDSVILRNDHPTKFAARAEAVMAVVSQLYDAKFGKDGE